MTTTVHYHGSAFTLDGSRDDDQWREDINTFLRMAEDRGVFDVELGLADGGKVSLRLRRDTPLAVQTS